MKVRSKLKPGENGTKSLLKEYGEQLVCVRYRYDKQTQKRYKTVELIVDEQDWVPHLVIPPDKRVFIRVGFGETELRERIKAAGGYWNADKKAWHLRHRKVIELGLEQRILDEKLDL